MFLLLLETSLELIQDTKSRITGWCTMGIFLTMSYDFPAGVQQVGATRLSLKLTMTRGSRSGFVYILLCVGN
jgi:hypothetical protein